MPVRTARYIAGRLPSIAVLFLVLVFAANQIAIAARWFEDWQRSRVERSDVFEYVSVEYVRTDEDGIWMASTAVWHRHIDRVEWLDRIECAGGGTFSSQTERANDRGPIPLDTVEWPYKAAYPSSGTCVMTSVITAEHGGRVYVQTVQSSPFTPGEGS